MSGIFGLIEERGDSGAATAMRGAFASQPFDAVDTWSDDGCTLGRALLRNTAEAAADTQPCWLPDTGLAFTAEARVDDRNTLCDRLDIPPALRHQLADTTLVLRAYLRWGPECGRYLLGDWSFAAWHPNERRLVLARDVMGVTRLLYHVSPRHIVFASQLPALLAVPTIARRVDDLHLAKVLTAWNRTGNSTVYADVKSLRSGQVLTIQDGRERLSSYWDASGIAQIRFRSDHDYVEAFQETFRRATHDRLRATGPVGVTLSGGLDSGSVGLEAAEALRHEGRALLAFSHVPKYVDCMAAPTGNERPYIEATASAAGIADVTYVSAGHRGPTAGMLDALGIHGAPMFAASNEFWILDLLAAARDRGVRAMLVGQAGNESISWGGPPPPSSPKGLATTARQWLRTGRRLLEWRQPWHGYSAIQPALARRLRLADGMKQDDHRPSFSRVGLDPQRVRIRYLQALEAYWAEKAAPFGIEVRDPTADRRVVEFCLGIPDSQYVSPSGTRRWLIRRAVQGRLPGYVADNETRGRQAADLVRRLQDEGPTIQALLDACQRAPDAAKFLNLDRMQRTWRACKRQGPAVHRQAASILMRGLMAGVFLAKLDGALDWAPLRPVRSPGVVQRGRLHA